MVVGAVTGEYGFLASAPFARSQKNNRKQRRKKKEMLFTSKCECGIFTKMNVAAAFHMHMIQIHIHSEKKSRFLHFNRGYLRTNYLKSWLNSEFSKLRTKVLFQTSFAQYQKSGFKIIWNTLSTFWDYFWSVRDRMLNLY